MPWGSWRSDGVAVGREEAAVRDGSLTPGGGEALGGSGALGGSCMTESGGGMDAAHAVEERTT
jgi:hypothetical protein